MALCASLCPRLPPGVPAALPLSWRPQPLAPGFSLAPTPAPRSLQFLEEREVGLTDGTLVSICRGHCVPTSTLQY